MRIALIGLALAAAAPLAANPCISDLLAKADARSGYPYAQRKDGRCEGRFAGEVAGTGGLMVASLMAKTGEFDLKSESAVHIAWNAPKGKMIHISAYSLRHQTHYQMDAEQASDSGKYVWPMDVLSGVPLSSSDLGIAAWYSEPFGATNWMVYLPVTIESDKSTGNSTPFHLMFVPPTELSKVARRVV